MGCPAPHQHPALQTESRCFSSPQQDICLLSFSQCGPRFALSGPLGLGTHNAGDVVLP